ncbi:MAG: hypothetical protein ACREUC_24840, partial [Steroidobacteraceae bacterium]
MVVSDRVRAEQVRSIYRNTPPGLIATAVTLCGFALLLAYIDAVELSRAAILSGFVVLQTIGRLLLYGAYRRDPDADANWRRWALRFTIGAMLGG